MSVDEFIKKMKCGEEVKLDKGIVYFSKKKKDDIYVIYSIKDRNMWLKEVQGIIIGNDLLIEFVSSFEKLVGKEACTLKKINEKTDIMHELLCKYWTGSVLKCGTRELKCLSYSDIVKGASIPNRWIYDDIQTLAMGVYDYLFSSLVKGTLDLKTFWNSENVANFLCDGSYLKKINFDIVKTVLEGLGGVEEHDDYINAEAIIADWNNIYEKYKGRNIKKEIVNIVRNDFNRYKREGITTADLNDLVYTKDGHFGIVCEEGRVYLDTGELNKINNCCIALTDEELTRDLQYMKNRLVKNYDCELKQEIEMGR